MVTINVCNTVVYHRALTQDAGHAAAPAEAVYANEAPAVVDSGYSPTEARAAAAASGGTATTVITEVLAYLQLY